MIEGRFRLLRIVDGRSHYALVEVVLDRLGEPVDVVCSGVPKLWSHSAARGVADLLDVTGLRESWHLTEIRQIQGHAADTRPSTVAAAAALAAFRALGFESEEPRLEFDPTAGWKLLMASGQWLVWAESELMGRTSY